MVAVFAAGEVAVERWVLPEVGRARAPEPKEKQPQGPTVRELEALQAQARAEGLAAGRAEGLAAGQREIKQRVAQLDALFAAAAQPLATLDTQTERVLAELAMTVARRVLGTELRTSPELVLRAVQQAAAALPASAQALRVHVHPADLALLQQAAPDAHFEYVADPALTRGGCRLESARSRLDARLETRLAAVLDAVFGDAAPEAAATADAAVEAGP